MCSFWAEPRSTNIVYWRRAQFWKFGISFQNDVKIVSNCDVPSQGLFGKKSFLPRCRDFRLGHSVRRRLTASLVASFWRLVDNWMPGYHLQCLAWRRSSLQRFFMHTAQNRVPSVSHLGKSKSSIALIVDPSGIIAFRTLHWPNLVPVEKGCASIVSWRRAHCPKFWISLETVGKIVSNFDFPSRGFFRKTHHSSDTSMYALTSLRNSVKSQE